MGVKTLMMQNLVFCYLNVVHRNIQSHFDLTAHKGAATQLLPTICPPFLWLKRIS